MIQKLRRKIFWSVEGSALGVLFFILVMFNIFHIFEQEEEEWEMFPALVVSGLGFVLAAIVFAIIAHRLSILITKPVEETMEAQKQFVADASHELKTPVAVMLANVSVLEKEIGENRWMNYIKEEANRVSELTGSLLTLSKIDYEQDNPELMKRIREYNLSDAVLEAALPFESVAFEQGVQYELNIPENIVGKGIPEDVKQVVGILADNALKHVDENGKVEIALSIYGLKGAGQHGSMLRVKNTGEEIPPDALPNLFNRFYKADSSRAYKQNSFGLGLAIAKSLIERNSGEIRVNSKDGITEFSVWLPLGDMPSRSK